MSAHAHPDRGAALIPALVVVAITSVLATAISTRIDSGIQHMIYRRDEIAASLLARAAIDYSASVLFDDAAATGEIDTLQEIWATHVGVLPVDGGQLAGEIRDAQGLFNLNNLLDGDGMPSPEDIKAFNQLAKLVGMSPGLGETLAELMKRTEKTPARRLVHVDELTQLANLPAAQINTLRAFITALPRGAERSKINLNTAKPEVIAAYLPGVGVAAVMAALGDNASRKEFKSISEFPQQRPDMFNFFSVKSDYFLTQGLATQGRARLITECLLHRQANRWPVPVFIRMSSS
ncbi:MAG: type secretion system minor pseudopilin GspK [Pseudomonadota bacterium]|jgi:general secretion pathway protein K